MRLFSSSKEREQVGGAAAAVPAAVAAPNATRTARRGRNMASEAALERQEAVQHTTAL